MLYVGAFPFQPRRLWRLVRVGATINDPGDLITKFFPDIAQSFRAAAIFHRIVEKRADRLGFIRAVFQRDGGDAEDMRKVRNPRFLAHLITMSPRCVNQRFLELLGQLHLSRRVRLIEPVLVTVLERQVPIRLVPRSMLLEILLRYHVERRRRRQCRVGPRLLSRFLADPIRLSFLRRAAVLCALGVKRGHTTHHKSCHRHHHKKSNWFEFSGHNSG
jgi:hypothetical protein